MLILDCGHEPTAQPDHSITNGIARNRANQTMCFDCAAKALKEDAESTGVLTAYSTVHHITTWDGQRLGIIIYRGPASGHRSYYQVSLWDGKLWYGWGPAESGTYVTLRRYKNQDAK